MSREDYLIRDILIAILQRFSVTDLLTLLIEAVKTDQPDAAETLRSGLQRGFPDVYPWEDRGH